jgi:hypothetical protein
VFLAVLRRNFVECSGLFEVGCLLDVFICQGHGTFLEILTIYRRYVLDVSCRIKLLDVFSSRGYGICWMFVTVYSRYWPEVFSGLKLDAYWQFSAGNDTEFFGCFRSLKQILFGCFHLFKFDQF